MATAPVDHTKRHFLTGTMTVVGGIGTAVAAIPFLSSMQPSARAKAAGAPVKADISSIEPGQLLRFKWRGKPVWVVHRPAEALDQLAKMDPLLADPKSQKQQQPVYATNPYRSIRPEILVLVGLCTHFGCAPLYQPTGSDQIGPEGGFFCPCHGSKFDMAGRVYANVPAPSNLEVPPYQYLDENLILIGEDQEAV